MIDSVKVRKTYNTESRVCTEDSRHHAGRLERQLLRLNGPTQRAQI